VGKFLWLKIKRIHENPTESVVYESDFKSTPLLLILLDSWADQYLFLLTEQLRMKEFVVECYKQ